MWRDPFSAQGQTDVSPEDKPSYSVGGLLSWGENELSFLGSGEARASSERLLGHALGISRSGLYQVIRSEISAEIFGKFRRLVYLRRERRPDAYLTGKAFFWDEVLEVSESCLIPRPETEKLVECIIAKTGYRQDSAFSFLDLAAGSGAIGIAVLRHFRSARGALSDVSPEALEIASRNLASYALTDRAAVVHSDLFETFGRETPCPRWDVIVSNPPYLSRLDLEQMQPEVASEPRIALDGGEDGLDFYRRISREAGGYLNPGGWLILEIGIGQGRAVGDFLGQHGFQAIAIDQDDNAIDRVVMARKSF